MDGPLADETYRAVAAPQLPLALALTLLSSLEGRHDDSVGPGRPARASPTGLSGSRHRRHRHCLAEGAVEGIGGGLLGGRERGMLF